MKLSLKFRSHWIVGSTAALLVTAVLGSAVMADTFYVSPTATPGTYNAGTESYTGGGTGTLANPFGSIVEAYRAAYLSPTPSIIQLDPGTYSGANLGTFNGQVGVVNLGGDGYFGVGAPVAGTPSITIEGSNAATISGGGFSGPNPSFGIFYAQNAYPTGLTIKDVNISTAGLSGGTPEFIGNMNFQGLPIAFDNDSITLGSAANHSVFYYEIAQIPGGDFSFNNSTIHFGTSSNLLGLVQNNYNNGQGPNADIFNGNGTSSFYDSNGNLITDPNDLFIKDLNPSYGTYQNGIKYWPADSHNALPAGSTIPEFAEDFDTIAETPAAVPEPSSVVALCGLGLAGLLVAARHRRQRAAR